MSYLTVFSCELQFRTLTTRGRASPTTVLFSASSFFFSSLSACQRWHKWNVKCIFLFISLAFSPRESWCFRQKFLVPSYLKTPLDVYFAECDRCRWWWSWVRRSPVILSLARCPCLTLQIIVVTWTKSPHWLKESLRLRVAVTFVEICVCVWFKKCCLCEWSLFFAQRSALASSLLQFGLTTLKTKQGEDSSATYMMEFRVLNKKLNTLFVCLKSLRLICGFKLSSFPVCLSHCSYFSSMFCVCVFFFNGNFRKWSLVQVFSWEFQPFYFSNVFLSANYVSVIKSFSSHCRSNRSACFTRFCFDHKLYKSIFED